MSAASVRMLASAAQNCIANTALAFPAAHGQLWPLRPPRPFTSACLEQQQQQQLQVIHRSASPASLASLPPAALSSPQQRALAVCAATKSGGGHQDGARRAKEARLLDAAADPGDTDNGASSNWVQGKGVDSHSLAPNTLDEDGFLDNEDGVEEGEGDGEGEYDEYGEGEYGDEDEDGDAREADDFAASFLEPDDAPREVATGGTSWGEVVLRAAQGVLAQPAMKGLELYLFRALPASRKVDIRLDKLDDLYGSPSIDDIERFQRGLFAALDRELGPEAAGEISFEVSSPGAERLVRVPDELERFAELPLEVEYRSADGKDASSVLLFAGIDTATGVSSWRLANVRANATVKGRALSKRQLARQVSIPLPDIERVRIHVDF